MLLEKEAVAKKAKTGKSKYIYAIDAIIDREVRYGLSSAIRSIIIDKTDWSWTQRPDYYQDQIIPKWNNSTLTIEFEEPLKYIASGRRPGSYVPRNVLDDWFISRDLSAFSSEQIQYQSNFLFNVNRYIFDWGINPKPIYEVTRQEIEELIKLKLGDINIEEEDFDYEQYLREQGIESYNDSSYYESHNYFRNDDY